MLSNPQMEAEATDFLCNPHSPKQILLKAPLEKLISSEKLTFIPNLYYQQYRLLDMIEDLRVDYPEQKILVPKGETTHEYLLCEMKKNRFILQEEVKYRKVVCFHLAKCARQQFFKKKLKKQQKYLFHRVAFSQLAQAVRNKFDQNRIQKKQNQKKEQAKDIKKVVKPKISDDNIFLQKDESEMNVLGAESDLLGDLFSNPRVEEVQEKVENPLNYFVEDYMGKFLQQDNRDLECKKTINRKNCLKKINENIRKRIKSKLNEDSGEKNLNSATVLITSLVGNEPDQKNTQQNLIDPPAQNEFLSHIDSKTKRKKQQNFQLKWNKDTLQQFQQKNTKFELTKSKHESNYLATSIINEQKQYQKIFYKNIHGKEPFPPSINSIPSIDSKYKINRYFNTPADREYETAIMRHNKRVKFDKFKEISKLALTDSYGQQGEANNVAKIFLNPQGTLTDRVIYQITNNKIVPINTVYTKSNLSKQQLLLLAFLVRKYLCIFGSNWQTITTLILAHPNFSNMYLSTKQIQQLYQIVKDKDQTDSIESVNMMRKRILPCSIFVNSSYEVMKPDMKMSVVYEEMTDQSQEVGVGNGDAVDGYVDLNNYEKLLEQPLAQQQQRPRYIFQKTAKLYEQFIESVKLPPLHEPSSYLTQSLSTIISEFSSKDKSQTKYLQVKEPSKLNLCSDWVLDKVKNQIKFNTPIRKRKNITDKSSQLVKILHTLKQRLQNPPKAVVPGTRPAPTQPPVQPVKPPNTPAPIASTLLQPQAQSSMKKTLPKPKPQDRKDKGTVQKQIRQRKKKQGKDEKDNDKDADSK